MDVPVAIKLVSQDESMKHAMRSTKVVLSTFSYDPRILVTQHSNNCTKVPVTKSSIITNTLDLRWFDLFI